jgi:hypothetical protein
MSSSNEAERAGFNLSRRRGSRNAQMRQPSHVCICGKQSFHNERSDTASSLSHRAEKQCLGECRVEFVLCLPIETGLALAVQRV